jgi:hypothetical protein
MHIRFSVHFSMPGFRPFTMLLRDIVIVRIMTPFAIAPIRSPSQDCISSRIGGVRQRFGKVENLGRSREMLPIQRLHGVRPVVTVITGLRIC